MDSFNKLTPEQLERLAILAEEAGEVVQLVNKIIRHGYDSYNPFDRDKTENRELLEKELGDLQFAVKLMVGNDDVDPKQITKYRRKKAKNIQQYLHHN